MFDWDTPIADLEKAYMSTEKKVGSWQKDILLLLLKTVITICTYLKNKEN